jgi:sigma-B regulation protein RsbU (phosphoserine phosphatase)
MKAHILSSIPLFSSLPSTEINYLAETLTTRHFPEQVILLHEGDSENHFYILLDGQVEIFKALGTADERSLGVREKGTLLGEMSLFTPNSTHTASVRSLTPLELLEMTPVEFDDLLHRQPSLAYEVARLMSRRLNESENLTILDLHEKNRQLTLAYEELKAAQAQIIEKERLERELEIARQIQCSILPQELPQLSSYDLGALMIPAQAVGGDFYDFIPLGDDLLGIVVGDVSDKGVPAALFMALTYSLVRAEASRTCTPGESLRIVNRHLLDINATDMYVTLLYGILHCSSGKFTYARAGHLPPVILDKVNQPVLAPYATGQALGLFAELSLDEQDVVIPAGGTLLIFSDGLTEAMNNRGEDFGLKGIYDVLSTSVQTSAQDICGRLWQRVKIFTEDMSQLDDFTVVTIQHTGASIG